MIHKRSHSVSSESGGSSNSDSDSDSSSSVDTVKLNSKARGSSATTMGAPSHLDSYLTHRPPPNPPVTNPVSDTNPTSDTKQKPNLALPDSINVSTLLAALAPRWGWTDAQVLADTNALANIRITRIADLRMVPKKGWRDLPVDMVVAEALRLCAWEKVNYKQYSQQRTQSMFDSVNQALAVTTVATALGTTTVSPSIRAPLIQTIRTTAAVHTPDQTRPTGYWSDLARKMLQPSFQEQPAPKPDLDPSNTQQLISELLYDGHGGPHRVLLKHEEPGLSELQNITDMDAGSGGGGKVQAGGMPSSDLVHMLLHTESMDGGPGAPAIQQPLPSGIIGLNPTNSNRILVRTNNQVLDMDRWCPHKQYDLLNGVVHGSTLKCPKHNWEFDLALGGACVGRPNKSLNCRLAVDW